ncbi:MAG: hypothetical protein P0Y49_14015 [Candidatus Pedobacter colombiensis]|uniref:Uncharacterized protein n=1 Tax=Candidatus Pedobacter colombiensis TaxID=3121371 RepID=A0AAJ6B5L1_9SPHI|nr:hypothetical protein [Pedobacter sp.]WEK17914.1 MAG: hypothetical protein P0Y49_14015 [Pedobacter sp.]
MGSLINLRGFLTASRNSIIKSTQQITDFNEQLLKGYYDPQTGEPLTISVKMPEIQSGQFALASQDVPLLAISPISQLGLSSVSIKMELWVLKVDGVIYVTIPSEADQVPNISSSKVNFSFVVDPLQTEDEFRKELVSVEAAVGNLMVS